MLSNTRLSKKQSQTQRAPMCVRFQMAGQCKQGCSLALVVASAMMDEARAKASTLFQAIYLSS